MYVLLVRVVALATLLILAPSDLPGIPCITDCVMAELEKLGQKYKMALKYASP